ncbi:hypothetical protein NBRC116594_00600 [Shimia sp. NS0008-38b]|uniref:VOC family protein n=1 Tax=Shimia sp. NS0008-38b TaxID=3127653 RepID=UPI003102C659
MTDLQTIPILLTPSVAETCVFAESLGFDVETLGGYAILRGHGIEIHYSHTDRPEACKETSCYIRGGGILELHATLKARGAARLSDITKRDWGMTEFYLHDPHGNLLKFGMSSDALPVGFDAPNWES